MKPEKINIDKFVTNLGIIDLSMSLLPNSNIKEFDKSIIIAKLEHIIEVISFNDIKSWMKDTNPVEDAKGWIVRLQKINDINEEIFIQCSLIPNKNNITSCINTGENLDSLWIENETDVVSIGTEDGEMMKFRSEKEDWMPFRFKEELGYQNNSEFSFTNYLDFGLETCLPKLNKGEKIYFHYLIATNKRKKSEYNPNEDDISTYLAVDFLKLTLIDGMCQAILDII